MLDIDWQSLNVLLHFESTCVVASRTLYKDPIVDLTETNIPLLYIDRWIIIYEYGQWSL